MEIKSFEELTEFIYKEYEKLQTSFEINNPSTDFIKFVEEKLASYIAIYDKPLKIQEKREIRLTILKIKNEYALKIAVETMPHNFIWKLFHRNLWRKIKEQEEEKKVEQKKFELEHYKELHEQSTALIAEVRPKYDVQPVDNEE